MEYFAVLVLAELPPLPELLLLFVRTNDPEPSPAAQNPNTTM
jgi:hypothetical protein